MTKNTVAVAALLWLGFCATVQHEGGYVPEGDRPPTEEVMKNEHSR